MKKLHTSNNLVELELIKSILIDENIDCLIKDEFPQGMDLQPIVVWPSLWVINDEQFAEANKILKDFLAAPAKTE